MHLYHSLALFTLFGSCASLVNNSSINYYNNNLPLSLPSPRRWHVLRKVFFSSALFVVPVVEAPPHGTLYACITCVGVRADRLGSSRTYTHLGGSCDLYPVIVCGGDRTCPERLRGSGISGLPVIGHP